ncbi:hypothetical protein AQUCO_02300028v1 [Aquilegia coerulea]|uniref:Uncharacterized protein n=1 Tax=Aquilegia coerulea TaxID=218851 RepID=A0A2G5DBX5_AQUCA|nr:hypothetical protein AQUCO_02300028v1 [Aquilegia coerulea]
MARDLLKKNKNRLYTCFNLTPHLNLTAGKTPQAIIKIPQKLHFLQVKDFILYTKAIKIGGSCDYGDTSKTELFKFLKCPYDLCTKTNNKMKLNLKYNHTIIKLSRLNKTPQKLETIY